MEQRIVEGVVTLLGAMVAFGAGAFVSRLRPSSAAAARLTIVLSFEGIFNALLGAFMLLEYPEWGRCEGNVHQGFMFVNVGFWVTSAVIPWYYAWFLGALGIPMAAPLAGRHARWVVLGGVATTILGLVGILIWISPCSPPWNTPWYVPALGPALFVLVCAYGLAATGRAWRASPSNSRLRVQRRAMFMTFGTRDTLYLVVILANFILGGVIEEYPFDPLVLPAFVVMAYVPVLLRGIRKEDMLSP